MRYPTLAAPSFLRPVAIFAGIASLVQATANIVLTILGILVYKCQITVSSDSSSIQKCFAATYFRGPDCSSTSPHVSINGMLSPETVFGWVCAYFTVDVVWFIISSVAIALSVKFKRKTVLPCLYVWTLFTLGVCCMDLAATIYFALQSQVLTSAQIEEVSGKIKGPFSLMSDQCGDKETLLSVPVILMAITARYFIFWLLNAALVTVIGVSALGISSRNSRDQDFFDDNISSQQFFGGADSLYSGNNDSRKDVSVIDGWKDPWQSMPVMKIPRAKSVASSPSLYYVPETHFSQSTTSVTEFRSVSEADDDDRSSRASSVTSPVPIPPPPPPPAPPLPQMAKERRRNDGEGKPRGPKKHPPPPPDQKPLKPALKNRF